MIDYGPDPLGVLTRAEYSEFMDGGGETHLRPAGGVVASAATGGRFVRGMDPDAGEVIHYRPAGSITAEGGLRFAEPVPAPIRPSSDPRRAWPFVVGRPLRWGHVGKVNRKDGEEYYEWIPRGAVDPASRPILTLTHPTKDRPHVPILGDFVEMRSDAIGLEITWCLRSTLDPSTVAFLAEQNLPLSVGFHEQRPPRITDPVVGHRRNVEQRDVRLGHVSVVAAPAYREAQLFRLVHA